MNLFKTVGLLLTSVIVMAGCGGGGGTIAGKIAVVTYDPPVPYLDTNGAFFIANPSSGSPSGFNSNLHAVALRGRDVNGIFWYSPQNAFELPHPSWSVAPLSGYVVCRAFNLNDADQVVGAALDQTIPGGADKNWNPIMWTGPHEAPIQLKKNDPNVGLAALAINNKGQIVGAQYSTYTSNSLSMMPVYWSNTNAVPISMAPPSDEIRQYSIDDNGVIYGFGVNDEIFRWATPTSTPEVFSSAFDQYWARGISVSPQGILCGTVLSQPKYYQLPVVWLPGQPSPILFPAPAGFLEGTASYWSPQGIVVGNFKNQFGTTTAFISDTQVTADLKSKVVDIKGWDILDAIKVDADGNVVAIGYQNSVTAYLFLKRRT